MNYPLNLRIAKCCGNCYHYDANEYGVCENPEIEVDVCVGDYEVCDLWSGQQKGDINEV